MKNVIFIRGALLLPMIMLALGAFAGINFKSVSFEEAKKIAAKENKLVFIDAFAQWCGPCKWLSKEVFTNEEVGKVFDKTFVSIKIDMETDLGSEIDELYDITAYPTLLAIAPDGTLISKKVGALDAEKLIEWVDICLHPENAPYERHMSRFREGERDLNFLIEFLVICIQEEKEYDFLLEEIYNVMPPEGLQDGNNMLVFQYFPTSLDAAHGKYFVNNFYQLRYIHEDLVYDAFYSLLKQEIHKEAITVTAAIEIVKKTLTEDDEWRSTIIELLEKE